jgi:serine protease AprX
MNQWQKQLQVWIALMLILGLFAPAAGSVSAARAHLHPLLAKLAIDAPMQTVAVIVQKADPSKQAERVAAALGAKVTKDLHIINAFAAEMTASAARQLAASPMVRWVSPDAKMMSTTCTQCLDITNLANVYIRTIRADQIWNNSPYLQGQGIGVAVVDSGINPNGDLYTPAGVNRQVANIRFNSDVNQNTSDGYGHGTVVSSIVGGDGSDSSGKYIGIAPMVNIINVKVSNDDGSSTVKDVVQGLQWVLDNKATYNIRVVNLSLNSAVAESYQTSPLDAAVEILWFNKIVVVASAGNQGNAAIYPPANDPFIITVGATDDKGTNSLADDVLASFSAYGTTSDGFKKPDLVAPGTNIIGRLVNNNMGMAKAHPSNSIANGTYFRMSGTSVAAPMVSGAVALLLQDEPSLNPDQVKYRLKATTNKNWPGYNATKAGAGILDLYAAVKGTTTMMANSGVPVSNLLTTGPNGVLSATVNWSSVNWSSVNWSSVNWSSVNWSSVNWSSVNWSSDYWENGVSAASVDTGQPAMTDESSMTAHNRVPADPTDTQSNRVFMPMVVMEN